MKKKLLFSVLLGISLTVLAFPTSAKAEEVETLVESGTVVQVEENENALQAMPRGGYIAKNHRQTNYRVTSGWYYWYTQTIGALGASRTYHIYHRNVSYTAQYDLYDQYSGRFIRTVSQNVNSAEEQWRLVY
ncbi:hypothetical protein IGJ55_000108 [Enterococcus sp. AZ170]|uniref:hypothetical protein n=1 Tax=unclassified Enterococcus TaxID=2608891 RepID=UPI003D27D0C8